MDLTLFVYTHRSFRPARKSQRVLGPIADAGQGGAKAQSSPAHGSSLGRLSKNCKKYVSHTYKSKKTPFGTTQQSTRQAPSSSTQTQVEFKLSSSWTQVELQSRRRRKPAEKSVGVSGKVGGGRRKSRVGKRKSLRDEAWRVGGPGRSGLWRIAPRLVENRSQACGDFHSACGSARMEPCLSST